MNVVGYVRLSRDEDKESYSSIESQMSIINNYAEVQKWKISKFYIDDNFSGYTFDRPYFKEMQQDLADGNIDIIIAKDLSRIGRHNAWTQIFIEEVQKKGKTIILPEEGKGYNSNVEDDILGIKTWYNEMYIKDISRKIRSSMIVKQKNGELIMGNYYGYTKVKTETKYSLTIDEEVRPIIELIFKSYINGLGYMKICELLENNNSPTPSEYIRRQHENKGRVFKNAITTSWQTHMIQRIIHNKVYIGTLTTNKRHAKLIKGKQEGVPTEEQYSFPYHHEAIISIEDFELTQKISKRKAESNFRDSANYDYIFSGFIECNDCHYVGIGLNLVKKPRIKRGYNCTSYQKYGKQKCTNHTISEEDLLGFFKAYLKRTMGSYRYILENINVEEKKKDIFVNLDKFKRELDNANKELKLTITQKIKDIMKETNSEYREIIEESYVSIEKEKKKKINELNQKISEITKIGDGDLENKIRTSIDIFNEIIESERPDKKMLEMVLDRILLKADRTVEFKLKDNISIIINE